MDIFSLKATRLFVAALPALVAALWSAPAAAASGPALQANPGHGTQSQQFTAGYAPSDADCQGPPMDVGVYWDGIEIGHRPMAPCPSATTVSGLTPVAGTPQNPTNRAGWHQVSAHIEMSGNRALASESNAVTRYFLDPSGDAAVVLNPGHAPWYENFNLTYTAPTGYACNQRMIEYRADGVGSAGTLLGRQYLHCPTTSNTASFSGLRVAGVHTVWAYVIDNSSGQDVPGTEAYTQFTVDPGDPPTAPGGPAPSLSNTGGGGTQPSTGGPAANGAPASSARSAAAPAAPAVPPAAAAASTHDDGQVRADTTAPAPAAAAGSAQPAAPEPAPATLSAGLARVLGSLREPVVAVPAALGALVLALAAWVMLGALGITPAPLSQLRALTRRLRAG